MKDKYKAIKIKGVKYNEHRYIMECALGRKLSFNEVVHHKNGDKSDNRLENLEIMQRSDHTKLHQINRRLTEEWKANIAERLRKKRPDNAKLTIEQIKEVKDLLNRGEQQKIIALKFKVSKFVISRIARKESSAWV